MRVLKSAAEAGGVSPLSSVDGAFRFGIESRTQIDSKLICADGRIFRFWWSLLVMSGVVMSGVESDR